MQTARIIGRSASVRLLLAAVAGGVACNAAPDIPNDVERRAGGSTSDPGSQENAGAGGDAPPARDAAPAPETSDAGSPDAAPTDAGTGTPGSTTICKNETTQDNCYACCDKALPSSIKYLQDAFHDCMCTTPGKCQNSCASSYCVDPKTASNDCGACLDDHEDFCIDQAYTKCQADGQCGQLFACDKQAGCADKPKK